MRQPPKEGLILASLFLSSIPPLSPFPSTRRDHVYKGLVYNLHQHSRSLQYVIAALGPTLWWPLLPKKVLSMAPSGPVGHGNLGCTKIHKFFIQILTKIHRGLHFHPTHIYQYIMPQRNKELNLIYLARCPVSLASEKVIVIQSLFG